MTPTPADDTRNSAERRPMSVAEIRESYAAYADSFERMEWADRLLTGRYRRRLFSKADGRVLDVACGTGLNFQYLPSTVDLTGIDISPEMLSKAEQRLDRLSIDGTLHEMDAQALEFPDDEFDTVISSLSTCTFPDPVVALEEMARVCKPNGKILLLEHGRSDLGPIARFQEWRAHAHYRKVGCRWDQQPVNHVSEAEFQLDDVSTRLAGIVTTIEARPPKRE